MGLKSNRVNKRGHWYDIMTKSKTFWSLCTRYHVGLPIDLMFHFLRKWDEQLIENSLLSLVTCSSSGSHTWIYVNRIGVDWGNAYNHKGNTRTNFGPLLTHIIDILHQDTKNFFLEYMVESVGYLMAIMIKPQCGKLQRVTYVDIQVFVYDQVWG